jgi:hypothetical protein
MKNSIVFLKEMLQNNFVKHSKMLTCSGFDFGIFKRLSVLFCSVLFCSVLLVMGSALLPPITALHQ